MTTLEPITTTLRHPEPEIPLDEAQLAAAAFLARYSARTLDAYRHDLRAFFQWAADNGLVVLEATRPHIELYRAALEAARTRGVDDRSTAVDGVWLLPVRSHRRAHPFEPRPIRPSTQGPAE